MACRCAISYLEPKPCSIGVPIDPLADHTETFFTQAPEACALCQPPCPDNAGTTFVDFMHALVADIASALRLVAVCSKSLMACACQVRLCLFEPRACQRLSRAFALEGFHDAPPRLARQHRRPGPKVLERRRRHPAHPRPHHGVGGRHRRGPHQRADQADQPRHQLGPRPAQNPRAVLPVQAGHAAQAVPQRS